MFPHKLVFAVTIWWLFFWKALIKEGLVRLLDYWNAFKLTNENFENVLPLTTAFNPKRTSPGGRRGVLQCCVECSVGFMCSCFHRSTHGVVALWDFSLSVGSPRGKGWRGPRWYPEMSQDAAFLFFFAKQCKTSREVLLLIKLHALKLPETR